MAEGTVEAGGASLRRRVSSALRWTRSSYVLISGFVTILFLIGVVWWPLAKEQLDLIDWSRPLWEQVDWLLLGIFGVMSLSIMAGADLKADARTAFIGLVGGLAIESWGTQTELWFYYTLERPPLWILPAWPIALLAIDRMVRLLRLVTPSDRPAVFVLLYWLVFGVFTLLLWRFVWPAAGQTLTILSLVLCTLLTLTPTDHRMAVLTFAAGAALGYFLELWGTTRCCWTYYTRQTPPLFAVLAHGMAAVASWRTGLLMGGLWDSVRTQGRRLNHRRGAASHTSIGGSECCATHTKVRKVS
jgi:hypothetical protein